MEAPREEVKKVQGGIRSNTRAVSEARGVELQGPSGLRCGRQQGCPERAVKCLSDWRNRGHWSLGQKQSVEAYMGSKEAERVAMIKTCLRGGKGRSNS